VIATAHGNNIQDLSRSERLKKLIEHGLFKKIIVMSNTGVTVKDF